MKLELKRKIFTDDSTIGELYIDGVFTCYTLEDKVRDKKIYGITAIDYGEYEVIISYSNRFKQFMPLLLKVPNFEGIRIHSGNKSADTEGCILVGSSKSLNFIGNSRVTYRGLFAKLKIAAKKEKIFINVTK
tara:strand:- start:1415 stop:1810 length:396 start_codon:yes stop_codon:yes gene_type:complete